MNFARARGLLLQVALGGAAAGGSAAAQTPFSLTGTSYTQNFDALRLGGGGELGAAANSVNLAPYVASPPQDSLLGWRHRRGTGSVNPQNFSASTGTTATGQAYSFGVDGVNTSADRAFGVIASGTNANTIFGLLLRNNTGADITQVTVAYTGEQWRTGGRGDTSADRLEFFYRVTGSASLANDVSTNSGLATDGSVAVPQLNFLSPVTGATSPGALDGNAAANRTALGVTFDLNATWATGTDLVVQWRDPDIALVDDGLAIDNFQILVTPVPEPAGLLAAGGLAVAAWRVRRRVGRGGRVSAAA